MSRTLGEVQSPPRPRDGREGNSFTKVNEAEKTREAEALALAHAREQLHRALGLTADQALSGVTAYRTRHTDRAGTALAGGELVIRARVVGEGIDDTALRHIEIDDQRRSGLDEAAITTFGAQALRSAVVERIIL